MKYNVTIGIPVYQAEKYLSRALESALVQSYPSIEFLIVDDGSTDGSLAILEGFQKNHPRGGAIRLISHDHNLGVSAAIFNDMKRKSLLAPMKRLVPMANERYISIRNYSCRERISWLLLPIVSMQVFRLLLVTILSRPLSYENIITILSRLTIGKTLSSLSIW